MDEIWKAIDGFESYYEVSNLGRVRSLDRPVTKSNGVVQYRTGRIKKQTVNKDGYPTVNLCMDGHCKRIAVHLLVAKVFTNGWFDGAEVNHKDFDRMNACATNLEWVTHKENVVYSIEAGRHICTTNLCGTNNPNYGNHKLSDFYKSNPDIAKKNQGRPDSKNGRARSVVATDSEGNSYHFSTIKECANFIMSTSHVQYTPNSMYIKITKSIKSGSEVHGYTVKYS